MNQAKHLLHKHLKLISFAIDNNYPTKDIYDAIYQLESQESNKQNDYYLIKALNELIFFIKQFRDKRQTKSTSYLWIYDGSDCPKCSQLDGRVFDTMPDKEKIAHEYCKCTIKEIDSNEAFERKQEHEADLGKRDDVAKSLRNNVKVKRDGKWYDPRTGKEVTEYGDCAKYVKQALNDGAKIKLDDFKSAKDYGSSLEKNGFKRVSSGQGKISESYKEQSGDVSVIQPPGDGTHEHGHMAMYEGKQWVSDQPQQDMWGGGIRERNAKYKIYRNPKWNEW